MKLNRQRLEPKAKSKSCDLERVPILGKQVLRRPQGAAVTVSDAVAGTFSVRLLPQPGVGYRTEGGLRSETANALRFQNTPAISSSF